MRVSREVVGMICTVGDKRLRVGLMLAGVKKYYSSVTDVGDEEIIITSDKFFELNKEEFERLENLGKVIIKYGDDRISDMSVRDLI